LNYLAHLFLADDDPYSRIGSLMGDFAKGSIDAALAPAIRRGIVMHRRIDSFTDAHAIVARSKRRIRPEFRRYAGILVDLYYDHFLALEWSQYSAVPLEDFVQEVYRILRVHLDGFPAPMQRSIAYMTANDLLLSYGEIDGIGRALRGIEGRLKRPRRLRDGVQDLESNYALFAADFAAFFPQLIAYVRKHGRVSEKPSAAGYPGDGGR
jgi:acyl carrier protein phosphodiesterase